MANTVWWTGQDGNVWMRAGDKVSNKGKFISGNDNSFDSEGFSAASRRIEDPNIRVAPAPTPGGGGGGSKGGGGGDGGAAARAAAQEAQERALRNSAIDNTNKAIGSLDVEYNTGVGNINNSYNSLTGKYDRDTARTTKDFNEQNVSNDQTLLKNKQNALQAASQGRRGLRGALSAIGALSGDGSKLADRAVKTSADQDLGESADTFATNAQTLGKAFDRYKDEDADRRAEASTAKQNQMTSLEGGIASKRQNFFQKMAELYSGNKDNANASKYLNQAGDLNSVIASKSAVGATPFTERKAAFTPGDLESYLAGAGDLRVATQEGVGGDGKSSLVAGRGAKDKKEEKKV